MNHPPDARSSTDLLEEGHVDTAKRTDEDIKRDIVESLYWDTRVDAADIAVTVNDGHVTLAGSVPTFRARRAAREDTEIIRGVTGIDNHVEIVISSELDTPTDEELLETVHDVLRADPDLGAADIQVEVRSGKVELTGSVTTFYEKELAGSLVAATPGVRGMRNEIVVVPTHEHDDEEIADDLMAALQRNRHVDSSKLDIEVDQGRVTIAGHVRDELAHAEAMATARRTAGVTDVNDQLHIGAPNR